MGDIVDFNTYKANKTVCGSSCEGCAHMIQIDTKTTYCTERDYEDGTSIYPIQNGKKSEDWGACMGEAYLKKPKRQKNQYGRNII